MIHLYVTVTHKTTDEPLPEWYVYQLAEDLRATASLRFPRAPGAPDVYGELITQRVARVDIGSEPTWIITYSTKEVRDAGP